MRVTKNNLEKVKEHISSAEYLRIYYPETPNPSEMAVNNAINVVSALLDTFEHIEAWPDHDADVGITIYLEDKKRFVVSTYGVYEGDSKCCCCVCATDGTNVQARAYASIDMMITDLKTKPFTWWLEYESQETN